MGTNKRETGNKNFDKEYLEVNVALEICIEKIATKSKLETVILTPRKESIVYG